MANRESYSGLDDFDCCVECGEHFADPHDPRCLRGAEEDAASDDEWEAVVERYSPPPAAGAGQ